MSSVTIADQYMVLMAITALITVIAVIRKTVLTEILSAIFWTISALTNMTVSTGIYQTSLSYLFIILALIFYFGAIYDVNEGWNEKERRKRDITL